MARQTEIMAIPFWMEGRACLSLGEGLLDVLAPQTGKVLRRVPKAGPDEAGHALAAARGAAAAWYERGTAGRQADLENWWQAINCHLQPLLALAEAEGGAALAEALRAVAATPPTGSAAPEIKTGVHAEVAVLRSSADLSSLLLVAERLAQGFPVVLAADAGHAPGLWFALCELTARVNWLPGVLNLLYLPTQAVWPVESMAMGPLS